jgi:hypothetical protein
MHKRSTPALKKALPMPPEPPPTPPHHQERYFCVTKPTHQLLPCAPQLPSQAAVNGQCHSGTVQHSPGRRGCWRPSSPPQPAPSCHRSSQAQRGKCGCLHQLVSARTIYPTSSPLSLPSLQASSTDATSFTAPHLPCPTIHVARGRGGAPLVSASMRQRTQRSSFFPSPSPASTRRETSPPNHSGPGPSCLPPSWPARYCTRDEFTGRSNPQELAEGATAACR